LPGLGSVMTWATDVAVRLGLPIAVAVAGSPRPLRPALVAALAFVLFLLLPQHLNGYEYRYLAPLDATMAALFGIGIVRLDRLLADRKLRTLRLAAVFVLPAAACSIAVMDARRCIDGRLKYADGLKAAHETLGHDLAGIAIAGGGRLAVSDAGAIPYVSGWWTLDLVGLNDAQTAVTGAHDPERVLSMDLNVLVLISTSSEHFTPDGWDRWEAPIYRMAVERGFARVSLRRFAPEYWLWVLARPDSPEGRALRD